MSIKTLSSVPQGIRDALVKLTKKFIYNGILARIREHQETYEGFGEYRFDPEEEVKGKQWDSFDNLVADERNEKVIHPVTVSTEAAYAMIVPFLAASNVITRVGKLPELGALDLMIASETAGADVIRAMVLVRDHMMPLISTDLMSREYEAIRSFRDKLEALVTNKTYVTKGGTTVVSAYVDFLKCIAYMAGNAVWETKKFTLNYEQTILILTNLKICKADDNSVTALIADVKEQVSAVVTAQERAAADAKEKKIASEKKAQAEKKAKATPKAVVAPAEEGQQTAKVVKPTVTVAKPVTKPTAVAVVKATTVAAAKPASIATKPASIATKPAVTIATTAKPTIAATAKPTIAATAKPATVVAKPATVVAKPATVVAKPTQDEPTLMEDTSPELNGAEDSKNSQNGDVENDMTEAEMDDVLKEEENLESSDMVDIDAAVIANESKPANGKTHGHTNGAHKPIKPAKTNAAAILDYDSMYDMIDTNAHNNVAQGTAE
jgi:hypothetical protein